MRHVLITHEVESYSAWKAIFGQAAEIRKNAREISYRLLRYDDDANAIVHFSEWSSLANARRFIINHTSDNSCSIKFTMVGFSEDVSYSA